MANIQLTHVYPQENFKLLELSPELLDLLSSSQDEGQKKPKLRLYLKSPASLPENNSTKSALPLPAGSPANEMFVNLCTDDRTFFLRQVSSSNSTLMIRPRVKAAAAGVDVDGGDIMEEDGDEADECSIVASCQGQLEVLRAPGWYDGKPFLNKALKVWELDDGKDDVRIGETCLDDDDLKNYASAVRRLFDDIPVSTRECIRDWIAVCAFVGPDDDHNDHNDDGSDAHHAGSSLQCYRPSASARLAIWRKILEASILADINPCEEFLVHDLWTAIVDGESGTAPFPKSIFEAVVRCCCCPPAASTTLTLADLCGELKWGCLDKATTTLWTGLTLLEASAPRLMAAIDVDLFVMKWKDLLPESWRRDATVDKLKGNYKKTVDGERIYLNVTIDKTVKKGKK